MFLLNLLYIGLAQVGDLLARRHKLPVGVDGQALNVIVMAIEKSLALLVLFMQFLNIYYAHGAHVVHYLGEIVPRIMGIEKITT